MFAIAAVGPARAPARAGPRPLRHQAALLPGRGRRRSRSRSELKALLRQPGFSREVDLDALEAFLAFNSIPAPLTIFARGAQAARRPRADRAAAATSACAATRARGRSQAERRARARARRSSRRSCASACATRCARTSSRTCRSGVLLSGGIDSSALAALAARESPYRISTFSIGFEERSFNELEQARLVAEQYSTDHHELIVRPGRRRAAAEARGGVRRAVRGLLGAAHLSRLAARRRARQGRALGRGRRRAVRRLLHLRRGHARAARRAGSRRRARPLVERLPSSSGKASFDYKAKRFARAAHLPPLERHHAWKEIFSPDARADAARRPPRRRSTRSTSTAPATPRPRAPTSWRGSRTSTPGIYLVDDLLVKTDRASMAHSLEARVPFCDTVVAELALALPRRLQGPRASRRSASAAGGRAALAGARFCVRASRASRSPRRPGCEATCSRSRATCCRPRRSRARASSAPRRSPR